METIEKMVTEMLPSLENWLRAAMREEMAKVLEADHAKAKPEKHLTRDEVCELMHITKPTLWRKVKEGKITPVKAGRRVLFAESEVKRVLAK